MKDKKQFIKALANFLVGNEAGKGICLSLPPGGIIPWAREWAALRNATPIFGFMSTDEAEKILEKWLLS